MEVIHRRCSGLDVHRETVVACVRLVLDGKITRESQDLRDHDVRAAALAGMVDGDGLHPRGHGSYRRLLEAGLEHSE